MARSADRVGYAKRYMVMVPVSPTKNRIRTIRSWFSRSRGVHCTRVLRVTIVINRICVFLSTITFCPRRITRIVRNINDKS